MKNKIKTKETKTKTKREKLETTYRRRPKRLSRDLPPLFTVVFCYSCLINLSILNIAIGITNLKAYTSESLYTLRLLLITILESTATLCWGLFVLFSILSLKEIYYSIKNELVFTRINNFIMEELEVEQSYKRIKEYCIIYSEAANLVVYNTRKSYFRLLILEHFCLHLTMD
jgi:hypothetical protein